MARPAKVLEEAKPPKPAGIAQTREIRLEVAGGERRVEIRLSDRSGEVMVAVRTPDHQLAERLRDNLPALSSRLEDAGLRAETLHPYAVELESKTVTAASTPADYGGRDGSSHQQHSQQQHPHEEHRARVPEDNEQLNEKGKDFEWFLSATQ